MKPDLLVVPKAGVCVSDVLAQDGIVPDLKMQLRVCAQHSGVKGPVILARGIRPTPTHKGQRLSEDYIISAVKHTAGTLEQPRAACIVSNGKSQASAKQSWQYYTT